MESMSIESTFAAILLIGVLVLVAKWLRLRISVLRKLFLPSSIIAGIVALIFGPQVMGRWFAEDSGFRGGLWPASFLDVWAELPGILINVVFAALFLGKSIPSFRKIWRQAGPMIAHGQAMAWGQYVIGLSITIFLLVPFWQISPLAGALIEISFEGGHGTAAGLAETFRELGFADGADLALGLATLGIVAGVILGTVAINWAVWRGYIDRPDQTPSEEEHLAELENRELEDPLEASRDQSVEPLSIHLGFVGLSIGIGYLLLRMMLWMEEQWLLPLGWPELLRHIPLFPLAMIGGVLVQGLGEKLGYAKNINRKLMNRISGISLDILIVSALGAISLDAIGSHVLPFILLALGGVLWNLFGFAVLARFMFPHNWVTYGLANFGQGMGMTVIGLLLVRMSDPRGRTDAMEAFGYKQLLFEPIVGGGLFTAASLPLIYQFGAFPVLLGVFILMLFWLLLGIFRFGPPRS